MSAFIGKRAAVTTHSKLGIGPTGRSTVSLAVAAALYGAAAVYGVPALAATAAAASDTLEEITVTARKRTEKLQDVPQSIDVFTSKDLQNLAISRFEDYATKTPSVSFISIGPGSQQFFIRGVADGSNPNATNTSTTGYLIDDLPLSYYGSIPDIHSYDIDSIEILNGPQGTLYGAGAMSGAIRVNTMKPDPNAFSAGIDLDGGKIDAGGINTSYEAFVNLPIIDGKTAIRLSAYAVHDGGFIDNVLRTRTWVNGVTSTNAEFARKNYNTQNIDGGRAAIKQVFNDDWYALLTYSYQSQRHDGAWDQDRRKGDRKVARFGPENGNNYVKTLDFHLEGDVGIGDLVYASTYWSQPSRSTIEYAEYVQYSQVPGYTAAILQSYSCLHDPISSGGAPFSGCKVPTQSYTYDTQSERWSNELRLQSKPGQRLQWLTGLYWEKTKQTYSNFYAEPNIQPSGDAYKKIIATYTALYAATPPTPLPQEWYSYKSRFDYLETTEFADVTFGFTERWSGELGVEHFQSNFSGSSQYAGYFWSPKQPSSYTGASNKWNTKAGLNFKYSKDLLFYASFGQGFRDGGINQPSKSCAAKGVPQYYQPDTLNNFEIGWKSTLLNGRATWNTALYYMPWKNYQTTVLNLDICPTQFNANLGDARIYGAESNIDFKISEGFSVQASASYNDSRLITNHFYSAGFVVLPGERLPYVPYFSYSANARYEKPLNEAFKGFVQYDIAHKGDVWSDLRATDKHGFSRTLQPAYAISNFRFGVETVNRHWTAEAYVTNLFDKNAVIFTNTGNYDHRETTNEPRVFGLRLKYRWGKGTAGAEE